MFDQGPGGMNSEQVRDYQVNVGLFINEGWRIVTQNIGGFIGFFVISTIH